MISTILARCADLVRGKGPRERSPLLIRVNAPRGRSRKSRAGETGTRAALTVLTIYENVA